MNEQALAIRLEFSDERTAHDLARKKGAFEWHHDEIAPRFVDGVAHANNRVERLGFECSRGANDEVVVCFPRQNIARICSLERDPTAGEINAIDVEGVTISQIERD